MNLTTHPKALFDFLWFRPEIVWPDNDEPEAIRTARLFNLIYKNQFQKPNTFWDDYFLNKESQRFLLYVDLDPVNPECTFTTLANILPEIQSGLEQAETKDTIVFAEEITILFAIGHPDSNKFTPQNHPIRFPHISLGEPMDTLRANYNARRIAAAQTAAAAFETFKTGFSKTQPNQEPSPQNA